MQKAAKSKLAELNGASNDAWENREAGMDGTWDSLGNALKSDTCKFN